MTKLRGLLFCSLCASILSAQPGMLDHAWQLVGDGHYDEAVTLLHQLIAKDPRNPGARLLLGSVLSDRKQPEAITQLTAAVRLLPKSAEAENALGEAYISLGDPNSAKPAFEKAIALNPPNGIAQLNLGRLLVESGDLPAAGPHLSLATKSLKDHRETAEAFYLLAKVSTARDDPANAVAYLQHAVQLNPKFSVAWSDLGVARQLLQDDTGALKAFGQAVTLDPADAVAQYRLGSELLRLGKSHEAAEHLDAAYRIDPQDQSTLNALQTALRREGRAAEADQIRQKLSDLLHARDERNQKALEAVKLNNQGAALEKSGDLPAAVEKYKAALALNPDHNGIRVNYAIALLRQGQWTDGLNLLHEASQREPNNPKFQLALKDALSQAPPGLIPVWDDSAHGK